MDVFKHITPHTTILTPNRRLSATLLKQYAEAQIEQGKTTWPTLDVLPLYPSWIERLWQKYTATQIAEHFILLTTHQEQILWEKILRETPENSNLLQLSDTAKLAKSAWETLKRWRVSLEDSTLKTTDDSRAFLHWATLFQKQCQKNNWMDQHSLADVITDYIQQQNIKAPEHLILIGFTEIAPQYQHLLRICEQNGTRITHYTAPSRNETVHRISLSDIENEITTMARWTKHQLNTSHSIGCVVPNLETCREQILRIFSDVFAGKDFNISAGKTAHSYPIIYDALKLLKLNKNNISLSDLSEILRSPFIGEAEKERYQRAQFDSRLRYFNMNTVSLNKLISSDEKLTLTHHCPALAKRLKAYLSKLNEVPKKLLISEWVQIFVDLLRLLGWPGERILNSHEYQVMQNCWLPLLNEFATFDSLLGPQDYSTALHYLICLSNNTVFQPESPEAPVNILGLLEAADLPFDHLWIMGLDDLTWPSRPKPNPFIPLFLQKKLLMPNASAERELKYCQQITMQFINSAKQVIFSHALQQEDNELRPSALLKNIEEKSQESLWLPNFNSAAEIIYQAKHLEWIQDDIGPSLNDQEEIHGGVSIFKKQAECPFKAFAEIRLHAKKLEETSTGLRPQDRGSMVHKALELIWQELNDFTTLILKPDSDLRSLIHESAQKAMREITHFSHNEQSRYFALELQRLEKLLWDWLSFEKTRPAFKVISKEHEITGKIGKITTKMRIDRIDELIDGSQLIIDYKTGKSNDCKNWFGERPDEPQLPLYCIVNPHNTIGIAFAQIHPDEMGKIGVSKSPLNIKSIKLLAEMKHADASLWEEQTKIWSQNIEKLGNDFYHGVAHVDPKDLDQTCRYCDLKPLCRIYESHELIHDDPTE